MNEYSLIVVNCSYAIHLGQADAVLCEAVIFMQPEKN
jgi:hypothetical protein